MLQRCGTPLDDQVPLFYSGSRFKGEKRAKNMGLATPVHRAATHDDLSSGIVGFWQGVAFLQGLSKLDSLSLCCPSPFNHR